MGDAGSPYARFRRALTTGNLHLVDAAARELGRLTLPDALEICLLMAFERDRRFRRAAARWVARAVLERPGLTLDDLLALARALAAVGESAADGGAARGALRDVCGRLGIETGRSV
jgi:hypothetical protein